ncbi:MAG: DNA polymerase III subunit epsilon [Deltaproteobacteria bacterium]|nr:DNA polymerase III subunit epsilon [Deltaproteobacteria bacterium]
MRWIGQSEDESQVVLNRFTGQFETKSEERVPQRIRTGLVLDVEATGLDVEADEVIELAGRPFEYDWETGCIISVGEAFHSLRDPGVPLQPVITRITGLKDSDLAGQVFDEEAASDLIQGANIIIAHNASYDRPMTERLLGRGDKVWACSYRQIDWTELGFPAAKLEVLAIYHGFFFEAHRAGADVDALLHLLTFAHPESGRPYLSHLLDAAREPMCRVRAVGAPFESKDQLKQRGYRWDAKNRYWATEIPEASLSEERLWLESDVYRGAESAEIESIGLSERFRP